MCLTIQSTKLAEDGIFIDKPIVCWKVMKKIKPIWFRKWFDKPKYLSPFRKTEYTMGEEVVLPSPVSARPRFAVRNDELVVTHWEVEYGIHSLKSFEDAQNVKDELELSHPPLGRRKYWTIVECEIGAGAKVYDGLWWDGSGTDYPSYASSAITLKEDADYEFDLGDIFSLVERTNVSDR